MRGGTSLTLLCPAQMQDQQVGDASVLREGQAERRLRVADRLGVAVHNVAVATGSIDVPVNTINLAVHTIHSVRDGVSCKDEFSSDKT